MAVHVALGARATTFKALSNVSVRPWKSSQIMSAAFVAVHCEHDGTT